MNSFEELAEQDATGEVAQIYEAIRQTYGAPLRAAGIPDKVAGFGRLLAEL